jgi:hypothetical protein
MLDENDNKKFSTSTPNRLTDAYLRVWQSIGPTSKHIIEDVLKVGPSWEAIRQNKGGYVTTVQRNGKKKQMETDESASKKKTQGGARTRLLSQSGYGNSRLHPDAQSSLNDHLQKIVHQSGSRVLTKKMK